MKTAAELKEIAARLQVEIRAEFFAEGQFLFADGRVRGFEVRATDGENIRITSDWGVRIVREVQKRAMARLGSGFRVVRHRGLSIWRGNIGAYHAAIGQA